MKKDNKELANDIKKGLDLALKDGSFFHLFEHTFGDVIKALNLPNRHVIRLDNPLLPTTAPLERKELWALH